ncbi:MAG: response regulator, partial [Gammaproteobacteria bacterium]|nr:response regulator [Gammaproteobacteria bacterium]
MANDHTPDSLAWLRTELKATLVDAREALEQFTGDVNNSAALVTCKALMTTVRGVLRVVESDGAVMLAGEMLRILNAFEKKRVPHPHDGLESLSRSMMQLPIYLDRIIKTQRDIPLVVLPLVNDLRAARGATLMSEDTVFVLNVAGVAAEAAVAKPKAKNTRPIGDIAKRLRPSFQASLLGIVKAEKIDSNLSTMAKVTDSMRASATQASVYQLFWVARALIEALLEEGVPLTAAVKRLLGQLDMHVKTAADNGEVALSSNPPTDLLNSMLYYVGRSQSKGKFVGAVRQSFSLDGALPEASEIAAERASLSGPSDELLQTVGKAILLDLGYVKDELDLYVRGGQRDIGQLQPQLTTLTRLANTLSLLGFADLRSNVFAYHNQLSQMIEQASVPSEMELMTLAAGLLKVERHMNEQLKSWSLPSAAETSAEQRQQQHVLEQVQHSVIRECLQELSAVETGISDALTSNGGRYELDLAPRRLYLIRAALRLMQKDEAADFVSRLAKFIDAYVVRGSAELPSHDLDKLADAIVWLEAYLHRWRLLGREQNHCIERGSATLLELNEVYGSPTATLARLEIEDEGAGRSATMTVESAANDAVVVSPVEAPASIEADWSAPIVKAEDITPDTIELFIEEAKDACETLPSLVNDWALSPNDHQLLGDLRRIFHTLKGSGRVVGALPLSEFSLRVEDLLNRLLVHTVMPDSNIIAAIRQAPGVLQSLVEQIETGSPLHEDIEVYISQLQGLAREQTQLVSTVDVKVDKQTELTSEPAPDHTLYEIFCNEASQHLQVLQAFVKSHPSSVDGASISNELERALHTLRGSATMARITPVATIVEPLHRFVQKKHRQKDLLVKKEIKLLTQATAWLQKVVTVDALLKLKKAPTALSKKIDALAVVSKVEVAAENAAKKVAKVSDEEAEQKEMRLIFADEAHDLLDQVDRVIHGRALKELRSEDWEQLKRMLHTLKGGARMVEAAAMADFAHALETLSERSRTNVGFSEVNQSLLQRGFDEVHELSRQLRDHNHLQSDSELLQQLRQAGDIEAVESARTKESEASTTPTPKAAEPVVSTEDIEEVSEQALQAAAETRVLPDMLAEISAELETVARSVSTTDEQPSADAVATKDSESADIARIERSFLDDLLREAGEVSVVRGRLEQHVEQMGGNLKELSRTVIRLREQLRAMEMEVEVNVSSRMPLTPTSETKSANDNGFDPLEMDRYSKIQQLSRGLTESVSDLANLQEILEQSVHQAENLLVEQSRVTASMQDELIQARMVPVSQYVARLERVVRLTAHEHSKEVRLAVEGAEEEIDSQVLKRMLAPLEHMLRNAVVHGIEAPSQRTRAGKNVEGQIQIRLRRERTEIIIQVIDDGAGLPAEKIIKQAKAQGRIAAEVSLTEQEAYQLVLEPGFSTVDKLTYAAGRGVGMDVVASEVKQLGGRIEIQSTAGEGAEFTLYLPASLAVTQALLVRIGEETYALPLPAVGGIHRETQSILKQEFDSDKPEYSYGGKQYRLVHLGDWLSCPSPMWTSVERQTMVLVFLELRDQSVAVVVDELLGNREIVVKPLSLQLANIGGLAGATILGNGRPALVLDVNSLLIKPLSAPQVFAAPREEVDERPLILVVDDSITVRRVTQRLLERHDMRVITAKDGIDAITLLREQVPDLMLLDIEMPRMDGY